MSTESIIPKRQFLAQILSQLESWIPGFDRDTVVTSLAVLEFTQEVMGTMDQHFARYGLSQGRFTVLMFLFHFPETTWTPASLAEAAGVSRATMTGLLKKLERDAWLVRAADPEDGRRSVIEMSDAGRRRLREILPDHFGRFTKAMSGMNSEDHEQARETLADLGARVGSVRPG